HACVGLLASTRRVRTADHFPLASLVAQFVSDLKLHGEHPSGARWLGRRHPRERRLDGLRYGLGLLALLRLAFRHLGYQGAIDAEPGMPEAGVVHELLPLRPARVHGVGEANNVQSATVLGSPVMTVIPSPI